MSEQRSAIAEDRQHRAAYRFGEFTLDAGNFELRRGSHAVPIQRKVFDVLHFLITRGGDLVSRDELLAALWPGEYVTDSALAFSISHVRRAIGQQRGAAAPIETIRGRGFRFVEPVERQLPRGGPRPPAPAARATDFVGRGAILASADDALGAAVAGRGALWALCGEAGIGKTTCCEQMASSARTAGLGVWWGRCAEDESAPALWPLIQILRSCASDSGMPLDLSARAQALAAELASASPPDGPQRAEFSTAQTAETVQPSEPGAPQSAFWMLDRVAVLLDEATRARPALIVIEDLHQADEMTLRLLRLCGPDLPSRHMLLVATLRSVEQVSAPPMRRLLEQCLGHAQRHELQPFDAAELAARISAALPQAPPRALLQAIEKRTGGNPLFVSEAIRFLQDRYGEHWIDIDVSQLELPAAVSSAIAARMANIDPALKELLEVASVIGERFELSVLEGAAGPGAGHDVLDVLDSAVEQQLLRPDGGVTRYAFHHVSVREVLYQDLAASRRVELHARIADVLETAGGHGGRMLEVAYHLHRALPGGGGERMVRVCEHAAVAARRVGAQGDAVRLLGWAIEGEARRSPPSPRALCRLMLSRGVAQLAAGRLGAARKSLREVADLADEHGYGDYLLTAARALRPTKLWALVPDALALRCLEAARTHIPESQLPERIRVLCELATIPPYSRSSRRSTALIEQAAVLAQQLGSADGEVQVLRARMVSNTGPDDTARLLQDSDEVLARAPDAAIGLATLDALIMRFHVYLQLGDFEQAHAALAEFGSIAKRRGDFASRWHHARYRAQALVYAGKLDEAIERGEEVVEQARRVGLPLGRLAGIMHPMSVEYWQRGPAAVVASERFATLRRVVEIAPFLNAWMMSLFAEAGRLQEIRDPFEGVAQEAFGDRRRDLDYLPNLCCYAQAAVALGDRPRMESIAARLQPYTERVAAGLFAGCAGKVGHFLGIIRRALGDSAAAEALLARAAAGNRSLGLVGCTLLSELELAHTRVELGKLAEARATLTDVAARSEHLGMHDLAQRANDALQRLA